MAASSSSAGADGSDAALSNKNLLLAEGAEIDTQPVLEIHADEVKAAHGATVGQLDRPRCSTCARADSRSRSTRLLTAAFCRESSPVALDAALRDVLGGALRSRARAGCEAP